MAVTATPTATKSIAIAVYDGVQMSAVLGLCDLFHVSNQNSAHLGGIALSPTAVSPEQMADGHNTVFNAIILPPNLTGGRGTDDLTTQGWIRDQHRQGALICSVCAGAFWLGHAGLLTGRPVTTHWALEGEFRATFPATHLHSGQLLIDDNDVVTAGGLMAWLDLGLFLVERWQGGEVLTHTARHLLVDPRGREQRNYRSFRPDLMHADSKILALQHWMQGHADANLTVQALAKRCGTSERTFLRRFKAATGHTPNAYVQNLRVEKARGLLERTQDPIARIAWAVGYQDVSAFSRVFKSVTGLTGADYRTRFSLLNAPA